MDPSGFDTELVVLVDANDMETGAMEKLEAHRQGMLHRAFSVLLFNSKGELLIQKRSRKKYHSGGLWTNTCCSHPRPGEQALAAVNRKLVQEMGIETPISFSHKFTYRVELENGLIEHEVDHVFVGRFDGEPKINPAEVESWRFESLETLRARIARSPGDYTVWFKLLLEQPEVRIPPS